MQSDKVVAPSQPEMLRPDGRGQSGTRTVLGPCQTFRDYNKLLRLVRPSISRDNQSQVVEGFGASPYPFVLSGSQHYFRLDRYASLSLLAEDAGDFVNRCVQQFDVVVVDIFVGLDVPAKFWEDEFLAGVGRLLSPRGISFFNVVIHDQSVRTRCADLFKKMEALVGRTEFCSIPFEGTENWIFVSDRSRAW